MRKLINWTSQNKELFIKRQHWVGKASEDREEVSAFSLSPSPCPVMLRDSSRIYKGL